MIFKDKGILKAMWAGMFFLCALLGFVPKPAEGNHGLLTVLGMLFFLPPALLLLQCRRTKDRKGLVLLRNLSLLSLVSTALLLAASILSILAPKIVGDILHVFLVILSAPMVCCQHWAVSLFLWAMLLWGSFFSLKSIKK
jgi:hypothetical protein